MYENRWKREDFDEKDLNEKDIVYVDKEDKEILFVKRKVLFVDVDEKSLKKNENDDVDIENKRIVQLDAEIIDKHKQLSIRTTYGASKN